MAPAHGHQGETSEQAVLRHARQLWEGDGRPAGGIAAYMDRARELAAIEESYRSALKPVQESGPYGEPVEENVALENLGEFPTLTDQGEEQTFPDPVPGDVAEEGRVTPKPASGRPVRAHRADEEDVEPDEEEEAPGDDEGEAEGQDEDAGVRERDGDINRMLDEDEDEGEDGGDNDR